jgi:HAD superfamily phosphatase (TIGR01668 family)
MGSDSMIEKFKPDMYQKNIYTIDYKKLKNLGIKCLLIDLDNTIISHKIKKPSRKAKDLIERLKDMGFKVILFSNASKKKLTPFKQIFEVDCAASAKKPLKRKYKKVMTEFKFDENEVAMIGDQLLTDIYGGNNIGIYTILVSPIDKSELIFTKFNRIIEKFLLWRLKRKGLFEVGKYYD